MSDPLKIAVERAVRPVQASVSTKLRMRRELYDHLRSIYDEEASRCDNDSQAVDRSLQRFGVPAELTNELQQTVSRMERYESWEKRWCRRRSDETPVQFAARLAQRMLLLVAVAFLFGMLCRTWTGVGQQIAWPAIVGLAAMLTVNTFFLCWLGAACGEGVSPPAGPVWKQWRVWLAAAAAAIVVGCTGAGVFAVAGRRLEIPRSVSLQWAALGAAAAIGFVGTLQAYQWERRQTHEWESLELEIAE